jgi:prepilin-type processing-associated H-X9-DG protein
MASDPQPLDYAPGTGRSSRRRAVLVAVVCALSALVATAIVLPSFNRSPHDRHDPRLRCRSNLRTIGQGVQMYAYENGGRFPDDFAALVLTQDLTSEGFVCLATNDTRAEGPTTQAVATNLTAGGHLSYVYTGKAMSLSSPATAVVAYEPPSNHGDGMNVLYADGMVRWLSSKEAMELLDELAAGHNPPLR